MRVGIYANKENPASSGGIAHALLALLRALGEYSSKDDEFIVFGPPEGESWLEPALSERVRLVTPPAGPGGVAWHKLKKCRAWLAQCVANRPRISRCFAPPFNGYSREITAANSAFRSVSTGFIEKHDLDVIHFPYQEFIVTSLPSIFNPHDLQHRHLPRLWAPESIFHREVSYRFACDCATKVAVAFPWVMEDLVESFGISRQKVAVIPWGGPSAFSPPATSDQVAAVRKRYELPSWFAFYPAIPWLHKNHANLLRCMRILKNRGSSIRLVLSGGENPFNSASWQKLRDAVAEMGLTETVKVVGYIATEDMRAVYKASSMVIVPTLFEAGSGPVAEAWAEDVPVACSDRPMLKSQAQDAAIYFDPLIPESIASAIERLANDEQLKVQLVAAGQKRNAYFSWERTARGYLELYRELAATQPRI